MKFRYYITSLPDGMVIGTNEDDSAEEYAACEDFFVVDSETGEWIHIDEDGDVTRSAVEEAA